MNREQRYQSMVCIIALVLIGAFLMFFEQLQTTGLLIIMFSAGFALRETLEPIRDDE
jgi:hypothetical protein